jgi:hypothetical protein
MVTCDADGDSHTDVLMAEIAVRGRVHLLLGRGDGSFNRGGTVYRPEPLDSAVVSAIVPVDIDGDLDLDVYLVRWGANVLLVNDGEGRFSTSDSHLGLGDSGIGSCAAFFDADGDGDLDLYVGNLDSATGGEGRNAFLRNIDGGFVDETFDSGLPDLGRTVSLAVLDWDVDGDADVAVVNYLGATNLYLNSGTGSFTRAFSDSSSVVHLGSDWTDVNGDLRPDLLVTAVGHPCGVIEPNQLLLSREGSEDVASPLGLKRYLMASWPSFCDFDNDGWDDLVLGRAVETSRTPVNALFESWVSGLAAEDSVHRPRFSSRKPLPWMLLADRGPGWMESTVLTTSYVVKPACGVRCLDANEDGLPDLLTCEESGRLLLIANEDSSRAEHMSVTVRSERQNRFAIGAQLFLQSTERVVGRAVRPGATSFQEANGTVRFGLGHEQPRNLTVLWPHGGWQSVRVNSPASGVPHHIVVREDASRTSRDPPGWLAHHLRSTVDGASPADTVPAAQTEDSLYAMERALLREPTDFELGWRYRRLCAARAIHDRSVSFFRGAPPPEAEFSWSLQRVLAYVDAMSAGGAAGFEWPRLAALAVYELERLDAVFPETWIVNYLLGLNLLYWPSTLRDTEHATASLRTCLALADDRRGAHLADAYVALGDALALLDEESAGRAVWTAGKSKFPDNAELEERLALASGLKAFCESERSTHRLPEARIPWVEEELEHSPLGAERRKGELRARSFERAGSRSSRATSLWDAQAKLRESLDEEREPRRVDGSLDTCREFLRRLGLESAWPSLRKGMLYLDFGYLPEHFEAAASELEHLSDVVEAAMSDSGPRAPEVERPLPAMSGASKDEAARASQNELILLALLGRADAARLLGRWQEAADLYGSIARIDPGDARYRLRGLLSLGADLSELSSPRVREPGNCRGRASDP